MKKRFYNINLFRIWFTVTIVYGHIIQHWMMPRFGELPFFTNLYRHTSYAFGYLCEGFFVISGFFMFFTFLKKPSFQKMIISKIARLWPVIVFSLMGFFVLSLFGFVKFEKYGNIPALFFLNMALTPVFFNDGGAWYINAMFWGYVVYYCLDKVVREDIKIYVVSLITFFCYSILLNKLHLYNQPQIFCECLSYSMIRGLAGMGFGYILAYVYNEKAGIREDKNVKPFQAIMEIIFITLLIKISIIKKVDSAFPIMLISFTILFLFFVFNKGIVSKITDKKIFDVLGRYCYSVYMMQGIAFHLANKFLWNNARYGVQHYPVVNICGGIMLCIVLGVITYHIVEIPAKNFILRKFNKES